MWIVTIFIFCATSLLAQEKTATIKVKKSNTFSKVSLDSSFTHLIVFDANNERVDSCIVSFDMTVKVPSGMWWSPRPDTIINMPKPVSYRSHCSYLTPEMRKAWKENPSGQIVYFQNILVKGTDKKEHKLEEFNYRKP